ncbi:MAG: DUF3592 domain-containing protein [Verrucomicrobiota bacterium]
MTLHARIIGGSLWLLMAFVPAVIGLLILRRSRRLHTAGVHTDGLVVGCDKCLVDHAWQYFPQVEFQSLDGQRHTFTASSGGSQMPRVGRRVRVSYLPHAPEDAEISSFGGISFFAVVMFLFAFGFLGVSLIYYVGLVETQ